MIPVCRNDGKSETALQAPAWLLPSLAGTGESSTNLSKTSRFRNEENDSAFNSLFGGRMLKPEECRKLAEDYRGRANDEISTPRLANVLLSVSNAYLALASQLDLLASVENQESARRAGRDVSN